ncbi:MAG: hypothetical protein F9K46_06785, partial [Anaerolineae bacterium]
KVVPSFFYEPSAKGELILAGCIACISTKTKVLMELNPVDEVYSAFAELVPELLIGDIEVVSLERVPGVRTKAIVRSTLSDENIVGYFIGPHGSHIDKLKQSLPSAKDEEFDIIAWSASPQELVGKALYPLREEEISRIDVDRDKGIVNVFVKNQELVGIGIGTKGINVRLARQITGYHINIEVDPEIQSPEDEVRKILLQEFPPLSSGQIEIINIARIKGSITKIQLSSHVIDDPAQFIRNDNPKKIISDLIGETIHYVNWSENPQEQIRFALYPLDPIDIKEIFIDPQGKSATVIVYDNNAINRALGKNGTNVKAATKLTGYKLSIKIADNIIGRKR